MICNVCNYNSETNNDEEDYDFWVMTDTNFEFERQEFSDSIQILNGNLILCPKCFTLQILPKEVIEKELE